MSSAVNPEPQGSSSPQTPPPRSQAYPTGNPGSVTASGPGDTRAVVQAQKERFGGMKFGACFFGWLTATGTAVLLTALVAAAGTALGLANRTPPTQGMTAETVGLAGAIALLVIIFIAYLAGGYVAGRMARFSGVKQGVGVFLWAVIIAIVVAVLSAVAGSQFNVLANVNGFPRIPINEGTLTTAGIITALAVVAAALVGAILGGMLGMRFHRKVDHADLDLTT